MRADAKVYVLKDAQKRIICINPSLKNLMEQIKEDSEVSRSCPDRKQAMSLLKKDYVVQIPLKGGKGQWNIISRNLGEFINAWTV